MISRNDFLKKLGLGVAGLSVGPWVINEILKADGFDHDNYFNAVAPNNKLWLAVHASGGWDPTSLVDPKGDDGTSKRINKFAISQIQNVGPFKIAPNAIYNTAGNVNGFATGAGTLNFDFFNTYQNNMCIVNGIDFKTNSHGDGPRYIWSGSNRVGTASFPAIVAAAFAPSQPLAFMNNGGYAETAGLLPASQINNASLIQEIALPNRVAPTSSSNLSSFFTTKTFDRIKRSRDTRHANIRKTQLLPKLKDAMDKLSRSRIGEQKLQQFISQLTAVDTTIASLNLAPEYLNARISQQFRVVYAAYKAGITVSATLNQGGFDTHGNHDNRHLPNLDNIMYGLNFIMALSGAEGISNRMSIMVASDFGRTPKYNAGNGKDHWPISSMIVLNPDIGGPKLLGGTDSGQRALKYGSNFVQDNPNGTDTTGSEFRITDIQNSLRKLAGIQTFTDAATSQDALGNTFDLDDHQIKADSNVRDNLFI